MYFRTLDDFRFYIEALDFRSSEQLMIMAGDRSAQRIPELIDLLNKQKISFLVPFSRRSLLGTRPAGKGTWSKTEARILASFFPS